MRDPSYPPKVYATDITDRNRKHYGSRIELTDTRNGISVDFDLWAAYGPALDGGETHDSHYLSVYEQQLVDLIVGVLNGEISP